MKTAKRKLSASHSSGITFRLTLVGLVILTACICNSCDPDDDTTDGTSGATSMNHSIRKSRLNNDSDFIDRTTIFRG